MIHVRAMAAYKDRDQHGDVIMAEDSTLQFSLVGLGTIKKFRELLNRSLNCAPDFGSDWFELSDRVDTFITREETSSNT